MTGLPRPRRLLPRNLPILWQTLLLLLAALLVAQAVSVALFLSLRMPRPDFNRLSDVADALAGRSEHERDDFHRERALVARVQPQPPAAGEAMTSDAALTRRLAARIGVAPVRVRLYFEPDQRGGFPFSDDPARMVPLRRGEPLFFDTVIAGLATPGGWRVVATPPRPLLGAWQRRTLLWFALSAIAMMPMAWAFARALTRPIRRFAEAADRMGRDPSGPQVPTEGPAELRVAGHALNRMQARLTDYLAERTAMIGAIAHDLRTPLARIAFRIEAAPEPVRDKVQADIEQMRAMIAATIGFVRGTTPGAATGEVELGGLLARIVAAERDVGRAVAAGALAPLAVTGDAIALERLFQNLVDNAIGHGGGGAVTVTLAREGGEAIARVTDTGPGIAPARIARMFHPFERGDPSRSRATGGIGLGLTIARAIAERHGATLTLANRSEGGMAAEVRLPAR